MLIEEAAQALVNEYKAKGRPDMAGFTRIVSVLCKLYPEVAPSVIMQEVVRQLAPTT